MFGTNSLNSTIKIFGKALKATDRSGFTTQEYIMISFIVHIKCFHARDLKKIMEQWKPIIDLNIEITT